MFKTIVIIILVMVALIVFVTPLRDFLNSLFFGDKAAIKEEEIIGTTFGYNPRVKEIQQILKDANFDPGPIDGRMGHRTRAAIREFQKTKGLKPTGKIDSPTQLALNREKEQIPQTEEIFFLEQKPKAQVAKDAQTISKDAKKTKTQDEIMGYRLKSKNRTKQIQIALSKANFYNGQIDGKFGPQTERAIKAFQKAKGLIPDGVAGPKTWEELSKYFNH